MACQVVDRGFEFGADTKAAAGGDDQVLVMDEWGVDLTGVCMFQGKSMRVRNVR